MIEQTLLVAANGGDVEDLQMYKNDLDLKRLHTQLLMLPDLIRTRNTKLSSDVPIRKVTNVRTICDVMKEVQVGKEMLSQVVRLLKIFYTIPVMTSTAERSFSGRLWHFSRFY